MGVSRNMAVNRTMDVPKCLEIADMMESRELLTYVDNDGKQQKITHQQSIWTYKDDCGTSACLAGAVCLHYLTEYWPTFGGGRGAVFVHRKSRDMRTASDLAQEYMGLDENTRHELFGADFMTEKQKATQIRSYAKGFFPKEYAEYMKQKETVPLPDVITQPVKQREKV